jgi:DNA anti-recombination protein RmuC
MSHRAVPKADPHNRPKKQRQNSNRVEYFVENLSSCFQIFIESFRKLNSHFEHVSATWNKLELV